ncbi:formylglycine-generating enzyme family protein [Devosia sp. Root635]|uniref:formylglycine-generating enzyme family protein n=1 Tax=Devosia sp. Root635 TaxID=1736575 RepID=UPI0006F953F9|nr:SUMF1/EgtB/PvdO family nonheme iron enzyme [Devosia sp. Root635]KRA53001.1 hypothetical protein ASD80_14480 [Devosia sp. Root635]
MSRLPVLSGAICLAIGFGAPVLSQEITWPVELYDPAGAAETPVPADLVLPMPCGGAMAFQKVAVPVNIADPLDDRRIRVGQSQAESGFADYLRSEYIRGAFDDPAEGVSYYYIARYELTQGQYAALSGNCAEPSRRDRIAKGGLSWFDAVSLSQAYSEWLYAEARDALPSQAGAVAYVRLPTEVEWEYAVRGGARVDPAIFPARRFFGDGDLGAYAVHVAPGAGRGEVTAVGLRAPNPLGLYDVYGNAEELQLEPFRLNAVGRPHGQTGGLVTRGGSAQSAAEQIYSAQRSEYPLFSPVDGKALASEVFGLRLVLTTNIAGSDETVAAIHDRWVELADAPAQDEADPLANLAGLIEDELDPRRQEALTALQHEFRTAQAAAEAALNEAAKSTLLSGAAFVGALVDGNAEIQRQQDNVRAFVDRIRVSTPEQQVSLTAQAEIIVARMEGLRQVQRTYLLSFRSALETLVEELPPSQREAAFQLLTDELSQAGQGRVSGLLQSFWNDLETYLTRPDMSDGDLLALALAS